MAQSPTQHQDYNGYPPFSSEFVYPATGIIQRNWYWFLLQLWRISGGAFNRVSQASYINNTTIYESSTGNNLGIIIVPSTKGGPAQPQTLTSSPFLFTAPSLGMLGVYGGEVEFSRDGGVTFYPIGLTGGAIFMLNGDVVRITWFTANPPPTTFFPVA